VKKYTCPKCGKVYDVPPKHCPCQPYEVGGPQTMYLLIHSEESLDREEFLSKKIYDHFVSVLMQQKKVIKGIRQDSLESSPYKLVHRVAFPGVEVLWHDVIDEVIPLTQEEFDWFLKETEETKQIENISSFVNWSKRKIHKAFEKLSKEVPSLKDYSRASSTEFSITHQGKSCQIILEFLYPATEETNDMITLKDGTKVGIVAVATCEDKKVQKELNEVMQKEISLLRKLLKDVGAKD
jgi:hypothetical protein